jgi:hypothetical protein
MSIKTFKFIHLGMIHWVILEQACLKFTYNVCFKSLDSDQILHTVLTLQEHYHV